MIEYKKCSACECLYFAKDCPSCRGLEIGDGTKESDVVDYLDQLDREVKKLKAAAETYMDKAKAIK